MISSPVTQDNYCSCLSSSETMEHSLFPLELYCILFFTHRRSFFLKKIHPVFNAFGATPRVSEYRHNRADRNHDLLRFILRGPSGAVFGALADVRSSNQKVIDRRVPRVDEQIERRFIAPADTIRRRPFIPDDAVATGKICIRDPTPYLC